MLCIIRSVAISGPAMAMAAAGSLHTILPYQHDVLTNSFESLVPVPFQPGCSSARRTFVAQAHSWTVYPRRSFYRTNRPSFHVSAEALTSDEGAVEKSTFFAVTTPFHLAIPVHDILEARDFFGRVLGCPEGRSAKTWIDFNLFGHQVVCHEVSNYNAASSSNAVDGDPVPVPHFGLAMSVPEFHSLADRVRAAGIKFIIEPHIRFAGQPGEQWTMFFKDSSGNALEFKAMTTPSNLFAKYVVE